MSRVVVKWNNSEVQRVLYSRNGNVGRYLIKKAIVVKTKASAQVGVDTGALKKSIGWKFGRNSLGPYVDIGSPLRHAYLHHEGTRPHLIVPKKAQVLRFSSKGSIIYTQRVRHPGTRPNRYLTDNLRWFKQ
jgi:hypothetical protein